MGRRRKDFNDGDFITCIAFCRPNLNVGDSYEIIFYNRISTGKIIIGVKSINDTIYAEISNFEPTHIYESKLRKVKIERLIYG